MSSAAILVPPREDRYSPQPAAAARGFKDIAKNHRSASPGHVSQRSAHSHFPHVHTESIQITSAASTGEEESADGAMSQRVSTMHVVAIHTEDAELVSCPEEKTSAAALGVSEEGMTACGLVGPPPPSPPASVERDITITNDELRPQPSLAGVRLVDQTLHAGNDDRLLPELPSEQLNEGDQTLVYVHSIGDTTDSPASLSFQPTSSSQPHSPLSPLTPNTPMISSSLPSPPTSSGLSKMFSLRSNHVRPPPISKHTREQPTRRNTTGSSPTTPLHPLAGSSSSSRGQLPSFGTAIDDGLMDKDAQAAHELANEIQQAAEQIRRERLSKRAKQQAQQAEHDAVEAALTRQDTRRSAGSGKDDVVLVGNLIGEGHVNYVLMYNMLTGIRVGVSRCGAKMKRELTPEDFHAAHKMSFDIIGNELTPSAKYDFKFKDYAPWVFRSLREDVFHLDPADYLLSLTAKYILSELGSPGKSGSFFYFSRDYRFIIKTIRHAEHKFLLSILDKYYTHVQSNPHTLLSRFYGLHRVKLPRGRKIHFVIMNNLFPPHRDIHETYDLKGSTVGRMYPEEKAKQNPRAVLKDLNWIDRGKMLELGPEKRALLTEQLRRDAEFLKTIHVMDYSLLVGIHSMRRGNRDNVRKNTLKVFSPDIPRRHRKSGSTKGIVTDPAIVRRAMRNSQTKSLGEGKNTIRLPDEDTGGDERAHFWFYQDEGGLRATDEVNDPLDTIYYLGIIDILTPWSAVKKLEGVWKGLSADRHKISPVAPPEYSQRFLNFMKAIMRGGEGGAKFKPE